MDTLEKLWQLVRQQDLLGPTEPISAQGDAGAAAGESSGSSSKAAKEPYRDRADRILSLYDRVTELEDEVSDLGVKRRNVKNDLLTQQDENLHLQLAVSRERRKVEHAWSLLEGGSSSRDVSPPPPPAPRREAQTPQRFSTTQRHPVPLLGDPEWDATGRSLIPVIQPYNVHTTNESDLNDNEDENGPPFRVYRNDNSRMRRCNALSSLLPATGQGGSTNGGALGHQRLFASLLPEAHQQLQPFNQSLSQSHPSLNNQQHSQQALTNQYHHHHQHWRHAQHQRSNQGGPSPNIMECIGQVGNVEVEYAAEAAIAQASMGPGTNSVRAGPSGSGSGRMDTPEPIPLDYEQLPLD